MSITYYVYHSRDDRVRYEAALELEDSNVIGIYLDDMGREYTSAMFARGEFHDGARADYILLSDRALTGGRVITSNRDAVEESMGNSRGRFTFVS